MARGYGNYTQEESITMFLKALKDPSNDNILHQIRKALKQLGLSKKEIEYYEMTGKRVDEWNDFQDEMDEMNRTFDNAFSTLETSARVAKKRLSSVLLMAILGSVFALGILMSVFIFSSADDNETSAKNIPSITESAPVQDGDKL
jgi:Fe2+ transport system protein B